MEGLEEFDRLDDDGRHLAFSKFVKRLKVNPDHICCLVLPGLTSSRKNYVMPQMMGGL